MLYTILFFSFSFAFDINSQVFDSWGGYSVSTSDNMDAFTYNPAGFGIDHGRQTGWYFSNNSIVVPTQLNNQITNQLLSNSIVSATKINGFGYSLNYYEGDKLFNPSDINVAFASKVNSTTSFGAKWSKLKKEISIGLILRPFNFISIGHISNFDEELKEESSKRTGLAIRPLNNDRLTIGMDIINDTDSEAYSPFIDFALLPGVSIRNQVYVNNLNDLKNNSDMNILTSININFGKSETYVSGSSNSANNHYSFGMIETSHKRETIFNRTSKKKQRFVRLKLDGLYIEEKTEKDPFDFNPLSLLSNQERGQQLRKWINEIDNFSKDESVAGLIIDLGSVRAGFAKKQEMRNALKRFKSSGKKIIVYSEYGIGNSDYYLISMADEIYINNMTGVNLIGLSAEVTFYRQFLDTLNIVPEVFRVNFDGKTYKTAGDPFTEKTATEEMKENYGELFNDIYSILIDAISEGRLWSKKRTEEIVNNGPYFITSETIENGLVTAAMYPDEFEAYVDKLIGKEEGEKNKKSAKTIKTEYDLVKWKEIDRSKEYISDWKPKKKNNIALIYAVGGIMSGESKKGSSGSTVMGDKTINKAIKSARENKKIDAIVLRIDSGGGSALASDQMWRQIELTTNNPDKTKNKPFIASMSDVAASGGYYIACNADKIIADEATITGSIGVIGLSFNTSKFLRQFGINKEVIVKQGEHSDFYTGSRLRNSYEIDKIEKSIEDSYETFKKRVIEGRKGLINPEVIDDIAMGRVWTGRKAKQVNLIDEVGGLNDAIILAAQEAKIEDLENINIIEYPRKDITEKLKNISGKKRSKLLDTIPSELLDDYIDLITLSEISKDGPVMIIPIKIEIK